VADPTPAEWPECPCCSGADAGDPFDLCDLCLGAALGGHYPHGCNRPDQEGTDDH